MASRNEHTGDELRSKIPSEKYKENYDRIFKKPVDEDDEELKQDELYPQTS